MGGESVELGGGRSMKKKQGGEGAPRRARAGGCRPGVPTGTTGPYPVSDV